eukprot:TRINITY_DN24137_c0_g1_i4.p1 TRINITY_DN24137_c0_g1~~TRINITY_DN24137_c0_g1_i4.p1  ORF type:complete len:141 (-),score=15.16 TRINITY_DN24137_c0_g1_i4:165-587(-)
MIYHVVDEEGLPCLNILTDNQSTISQIATHDINMASKHIQVRHHWIRSMTREKKLSFSYVCSVDHIADLHTKVLGAPRLDQLRRMADMMSSEAFDSMCPASEDDSLTARECVEQNNAMDAAQAEIHPLALIQDEINGALG